jgi:UV DNA damage endonuclease
MYNLCCISNELKEQGYSFKTMTWKRFCELKNNHGHEFAINELGSRYLNNVRVTHAIIKHCDKNGWGYRVSSDLFPVLTHPDANFELSDFPQYDAIIEEFRQIREAKYNVRLSTHPDQFNVLASENVDAVRKTIRELCHHGMIMDLLGCEQNFNNPINLHVNCTSGKPEDIAMRFMYWHSLLPNSVRSRLVVENEDKGIWTVSNLLKYFWEEYGIPVTFDNLHHKCNPCGMSEELAMGHCAGTWYHYGAKPLFHYSESCPNNKNKRAHAELPTDIPPSDKYDWDIELKKKDQAIRHLHLIELIREAENRGEYDIGPQRGPSGIAKINAEIKSVKNQLLEIENDKS